MSTDAENDSRVTQILAGTIIPAVLSSVFVVARLYSRGILNRNWCLDDTLVAVAWIFSVGSTLIICLQTKWGFGHHSIFQNPSDRRPFLLASYVDRILYQLTLCLTKIGLSVFYRRVFDDDRSKRLMNWTISFLVLSEIVILALAIFQCFPIEDSWSLQLEVIKVQCMPFSVMVYVSAVCNIVADTVLVAFAVPRVLPLTMPRGQKVALLIVVSLGILVIVAAIARCIFVIKLPLDDTLWYGVNASTWSTIEMQTSLFCISAPCIRPLLRKLFPKIMPSTSQRKYEPSRARRRTKGGIYRNETCLTSHGSCLERGVQPLDDLELGTVSDSTKNLCPQESTGYEEDGDTNLVISRSRSKSLEIVETLSVLVTNTGSESAEMEKSNQNTATGFEDV